MLSKDAYNLNTTQLSTKATEIFNALFHRTDVSGVSVTPSFANPSAGTYKLVVGVSGQVPTSFTKLIGKTSLTVDVSSEVVWGMRKLELALALDNTGSMESSNKMTRAQEGGEGLLTSLIPQPR